MKSFEFMDKEAEQQKINPPYNCLELFSSSL
jgi:hypothetical protein